MSAGGAVWGTGAAGSGPAVRRGRGEGCAAVCGGTEEPDRTTEGLPARSVSGVCWLLAGLAGVSAVSAWGTGFGFAAGMGSILVALGAKLLGEPKGREGVGRPVGRGLRDAVDEVFRVPKRAEAKPSRRSSSVALVRGGVWAGAGAATQAAAKQSPTSPAIRAARRPRISSEPSMYSVGKTDFAKSIGWYRSERFCRINRETRLAKIFQNGGDGIAARRVHHAADKSRFFKMTELTRKGSAANCGAVNGIGNPSNPSGAASLGNSGGEENFAAVVLRGIYPRASKGSSKTFSPEGLAAAGNAGGLGGVGRVAASCPLAAASYGPISTRALTTPSA